jgi:hypothetical protein
MDTVLLNLASIKANLERSDVWDRQWSTDDRGLGLSRRARARGCQAGSQTPRPPPRDQTSISSPDNRYSFGKKSRSLLIPEAVPQSRAEAEKGKTDYFSHVMSFCQAANSPASVGKAS